MELKTLIKEANELRQQRQKLQVQDARLKEQLEQLEQQIKTLADGMEQEYSDLSEEEFQLLLSEIGDEKRITIEVVYAENDNQNIIELQVPHGATIEDGVVLSGILDQVADIDLSQNKVGIYGMVKPLTETLHDGDRIEIYRPVNA
jgi:putative ubiquitin-RnfH superfamily antitoxin RatB of RatAB toxin-antitoxin module